MKPLLRRLLREPLVYFLLAAAALYALHALWQAGAGDEGHRIVVDRPTLLRYLQYRAQTFEPATFAARLDGMSDAERKRLVDDYVREEALYREALALGLQRDDNVMRLRLVQKMSFLLERPAETPDDAQLQSYFAAHRQEYASPPAWTFAHVFVDVATRGDERARADAQRLLRQLNATHAQFNDAPRYSDRFPYFQNYVERTPDFIESHFGARFLAALEALPAGTAVWQGPLRSDHGWHLLLVTSRQSGGAPELAQVRARVIDDYLREQAAKDLERSQQEVVSRYRVIVRDLAGRGDPP